MNNNDPLVIIDGIEGSLANLNRQNRVRLNPEGCIFNRHLRIARINGVVLVTTKKVLQARWRSITTSNTVFRIQRCYPDSGLLDLRRALYEAAEIQADRPNSPARISMDSETVVTM
jgi:hypothetical protein